MTWTVLARRTVLQDRWLTVHAETVRTTSGVMLDPYYVIDERSWSCAVPVLPDGRLVVVQQYRHGAQHDTWEWPAGDIEPGEDPAAAAVRELREETGYAADGHPQSLGAYYPEPARNRSRGHGFVIRVAGEPGATACDPAETVQVRAVTSAELDAAIVDGRFCHGLQIAFWLRARARGLV